MTISLKNILTLNQLILTDKQLKQLEHFISLYQEWNAVMNLSSHNIDDLLAKDIVDHLIICRLLEPFLSTYHLLDMGAGSGFCGLMFSIYYKQASVSFLESHRKKINFIRHCSREMKLTQSMKFLCQRAENPPDEEKNSYNLILSRATWSIDTYLKYAQNYVQNNGQIGFLSGPLKNLPETHSIPSTLSLILQSDYKILPQKYERKFFLWRFCST